MTLPELASVYYSQWDPDHVGTGDCVPTSAKMLLRWYCGIEVPIRQLRDEMDLAADGVRDLARDSGITLEAARSVLTAHGVSAIAVYARDLTYGQLCDYVQRGQLPIIFVEYTRITNRMDLGFPPRALHALWLVGVDGDRAWLKDPDRWGTAKADAFYTLPGELEDAWDSGAALGGGAIIPTDPREGQDVTFTDEDRRRLGVIYEALAPGDDGVSIFDTIRAGFNDTLRLALRRLGRGLGSQRDPFVAYADDEQPIT